MFANRAEAWRWGTAVLRAAGIDSPRLEARLLLGHVQGVPQEALIGAPDGSVPDGGPYRDAIARRAGREPLALILGWREFWSLRFAVSPATLIPRPESETIVTAALGLAGQLGWPRRVLDLGTGTGCLLLALLHEFPNAFGIGVDRVEAACRLAASNARALGLAARAGFLCSDWAAAMRGPFDLIVGNPPYIAASDLAGLMPEVAGHEPASALDGGADGLAAYRVIFVALPGLLAEQGQALFEFGAGQGASLEGFARSAGFIPRLANDLSGTARVILLQRGQPDEKTFGSAGSGR